MYKSKKCLMYNKKSDLKKKKDSAKIKVEHCKKIMPCNCNEN